MFTSLRAIRVSGGGAAIHSAMRRISTAKIHCVFDEQTCSAQYVVADPKSNAAAILDSVLDYDAVNSKLSTENANKLVDVVKENDYDVKWILETHVHADHITAAQFLKQRHFPNAKTAISHNVTKVQEAFKSILNLEIDTDGSQFDRLLHDNEEIDIGGLSLKTLCTPGHTPACMTYYIKDDCVFVGDTVFMEDSGCARCDFPMGSATQLYESIQKILALGDDMRLFVCHDYQANGSRPDYKWQTTIGQQKQRNDYIRDMDRDAFIEKRETRDATLSAPRLLWPSLQFNLLGGMPPKPEANGVNYIKTPIRNTAEVFAQ